MLNHFFEFLFNTCWRFQCALHCWYVTGTSPTMEGGAAHRGGEHAVRRIIAYSGDFRP